MTVKTKSTETVQHAAAVAVQEGQDYMTTGFEKTLASVKEGMENAAKGFEAQQAKMKEGMAKAMKTTEELVAFGQGNVEAFVKAGQIFASGLQGLSRHIAASAQASVEETVATAKALSGVKSVKEAVDLQSSFARTMMEKAVAETGKLTDASLKLTEQTIAPITARVTLAVEKFGAAL
ncbi:phasin family protein [Acidiphilium sp. AL]|uniref:Phasin family protein n=1 Tax=Acidiphilium iwatense TaxID=768198 RepID=A0ABS9DST2_9PROT|nr:MULTISPECIES: phasin family protein [Acidiphilium]MCF3945752.1 phasin family protein [Acidiphilium iwatense]MCU4159333.1 phasin family protein [Acidiphilium sp. AL]